MSLKNIKIASLKNCNHFFNSLVLKNFISITGERMNAIFKKISMKLGTIL